MRFIDILDRIDSYFEGRKKNETYIIVAAPALLLFFLSYIYVIPYSERILNQVVQERSKLKSEIEQSQSVISTIKGANSLATITQEIERLNQKQEQVSTEIDAIKSKVAEFESTQKRWNESLKFITDSAEDKQIEIENLQTTRIGDNYFNYFNANIDAKGEFKDILKYINTIETNEPLLRVENGTITYEDGLILDLNLSSKRLNF